MVSSTFLQLGKFWGPQAADTAEAKEAEAAEGSKKKPPSFKNFGVNPHP